MKKAKIVFSVIITLLLATCVAIMVYAFRADYKSGVIGHGASASGGLYINTGSSYSASADTTINHNGYPHSIFVSVTITPYNDSLPPITDSKSSSEMSYIQVNAGPVTTTNAKSASGSHSASIHVSPNLTYTWSDTTHWTKG